MPKTTRERAGNYTISNVRRVGSTNEYRVTVQKNGRSVGEVTVLSTSSDSAYFNDSRDDVVNPDSHDETVGTNRVPIAEAE